MGKVTDKIKNMMPGSHDTTTGTHTGMAGTTGTTGTTGTGTTGAYGTEGYTGTGTETYGTTGAQQGVYSETGATTRTENVEGAVCGQEYFGKVEDRPIVRERVEYIKEHRPVEKEFVVETRPTGVVREMTEGRTTEHLGTTERVVAEAAPKGPCE